MPKPFDSTAKYLIATFPGDWLALAGLTPTPGATVELIDANLSTITAEADKVIRVDDPHPWLAHVEFQASRDTTLPTRMHRYNALLDERHGLPVRSVAILLHPRADGRELTGEYRRRVPGQPDHLVFGYAVIRVWQESVAHLLNGGLGTLPLAPLAASAGLPTEEIVRALRERIAASAPAEAGLLWNSVALLMGLNLPAHRIVDLLGGVREMEESSFYQYIKSLGRAEGQALGLAEGRAEGQALGLAEGRAEGQALGLSAGRLAEVRRLIVRQGERRFGPIPAPQREAIAATTDPDRLEGWLDQVVDPTAAEWPDLSVRVDG